MLVNAPLTILFLSDTYGGRTHDKPIADAMPYPLPAGSGLLQDLGFLGFTLPGVEILMPDGATSYFDESLLDLVALA